jgi:hypothetical protein
MQKIIRTFIKAGFVMTGVMRGVILNAWWCHECNVEHRGECPQMATCRYRMDVTRRMHLLILPHFRMQKVYPWYSSLWSEWRLQNEE